MDPNFNSDSTYCSEYETSKRSLKTKHKKNTKVSCSSSQFLDKVHDKVLLHLEGKLLMGRIQVQYYMKNISRMRPKSAKDQYFAEKIQSSLRKIFKLTEQFERSLSLSQISFMSDPLENYTCDDNINILQNIAEDPKHILLGSSISSVNCGNDSFPLNLLTNNDFLSLPSQNLSSQIGNSVNSLQNQAKEAIESNKFRAESSDFSSENTEVYIEHENFKEGSNLFKKPVSFKRELNFNPDEVVHSTKKLHFTRASISDEICIYENNSNDFVDNCQNNTDKEYSENYIKTIYNTQSVKERSDTEKNNTNNMIIITDMISTNEVELSNSKSHCDVPERIHELKHNINENETNIQFSDIVSKIMKNVETDPTYDNLNSNLEISKTTSDANFGTLNINLVRKVDLNTVIKLGDIFDESYKKKIGRICCTLGNESKNKTWQEIHNDLEREENLSRDVNHTLMKLFEKLSLAEHKRNESEYQNKLDGKESVHNFSEEDNKKLDWTNLTEKNKAKLERISEDFEGYFLLDGIKTTDVCEDDDFDGLCWKKLLE